jgi:hypothetical protein
MGYRYKKSKEPLSLEDEQHTNLVIFFVILVFIHSCYIIHEPGPFEPLLATPAWFPFTLPFFTIVLLVLNVK